MYNLFSLGAGLAAWALGWAAALGGKFGGCAFGSLSLCILSLLSQFLEINRLLNKRDWAAVEDIFPAVLLAAAVLSLVTLALNVIAFLRSRKR